MRETPVAPEESAERAPSAASVSRVGYAPITRVDAARREIELCATSEALDSFGTIFDYEASRDAFTRWIGNIREMHERRAVGSSVAVRCDDEARRIYVRARISRGAQDTWEKIVDGTLRGASIGAANVVWRRERRNVGGRARLVNTAMRYDLAELSLVDNPSNPDALGVAIVRNAEPNMAILDAALTEEGDARASADEADDETPAAEQPQPAAPTAMEAARATLHSAARAILTDCGCVLCALALAALDADSADDDDNAEQAPARLMVAMTAALRANASSLARLESALRESQEARSAEKTLSFEERGWGAVGAGRGRAADDEIAALHARVARLEAQPMPGGPAARAVAPVAIEKTLAAPLDSHMTAPGPQSLSALEALAGRLRDPQAQMAVAAEIIRLQQEESRP